MSRLLTILFLSACLAFNSSVANAQSWTLEKEGEGILVYTRLAQESDIKEFKVLATVNAKRADVFKVVTKVAAYSTWYPDISESKLLKIISKQEHIVYYRVDVPWPASDRDAVIKLVVKYYPSKQETLILLEKIIGIKKEVPGVVRMPQIKGFWKLTAIGDQTKIHYQVIGNPGGSLPAWIINMFMVEGPYNTILALQKKLGSL